MREGAEREGESDTERERGREREREREGGRESDGREEREKKEKETENLHQTMKDTVAWDLRRPRPGDLGTLTLTVGVQKP